MECDGGVGGRETRHAAAPLRRLRLGARILVAALTCGAALALGIGQDGAPAPADADEAAFGVEVYLRSYCGACHALSAAGTKGAFGPAHDDARPLAEERLLDPAYRGRATTAEDYFRESIVEPAAYIVPGYAATPHAMPAYTNFDERELAALVALLMQQDSREGGP
jgi:mono/diheme cytochrome c family protein